MASSQFRWRAGDAYLFDIDGTLLRNPDRVHAQAFLSAVRTVYGVAPVTEGLPLPGKTDIGILRAVLERAGVAAEEIEARLPQALEHMRAEVSRRAGDLRPELCPGVTEVLAALQKAGKLLGVASGNLERIGWLKLEACGLRPYFAFGAFSDSHESREQVFRHELQEARQRLGTQAAVYFLGDTPEDVLAARQVGAPVIAVATGVFSLDELRALSPDLCVSSCVELLALP